MPTKPRRLTLVTQNVWGGAPLWARRREALGRSLGSLSADVIGLQEIHAKAGRASQAHELAEHAGYDAIYAPGRVTTKGRSEGVALLVRRGTTVVSHEVLTLSRDEDDALDAPLPRVVLRARIRVDDGANAELDVLVTHLSLSTRARARMIEELAAFAEQGRRDGVSQALLGDFNATPGEPALGVLTGAGWVDAWREHAAKERGGTWPSVAPFRRIDYLFVRPAERWRIRGCAMTAVAGSDHLGLLVRLGTDDP